MSHNTFGHLFRFTSWGESHGPAIGCVVDGTPPLIKLSESDIQTYLDKRRPGTSRFVTQRNEPDQVKILSGVFEGQTTGTPISLLIENKDQRSKDYSDIKSRYRPGHADLTYDAKYGIRDYRGGGRSSARETANRVAAGAIARKILGDVEIKGAVVQIGEKMVDGENWDWAEVNNNPFWCPDAVAAKNWEDYLDSIRKSGNSVGAIIEVRASNVPAGWGAPIYGKLDSDIAMAQPYNLEIIISDERDALLETGGGLVKALPLLGKDPILICNIDAIWAEFAPVLPSLLAAWQADKMDSLFLLARRDKAMGYHGKGDFDRLATGQIRRRRGDSAPFIYAGVEIFKPDLARGFQCEKFSRNLIWDKSLAQQRIYGAELPGFWMHVGDPKALKAAQAIWAQSLRV